jgi:hypothetical protein
MLQIDCCFEYKCVCFLIFFYFALHVQGTLTFGQSVAANATVGVILTGRTVVHDGGSLVCYGVNYIVAPVIFTGSSLLVCSFLINYYKLLAIFIT